LSTFSAQPVRLTIGAVRFRSEAAYPAEEIDIRDLALDWQEDAACAHHREVDFFPARGESVRDAKAVCACCPVRAQCLDFALRLKVAHGVWGGLSERERRSLRRDRHRETLADRTH
jgi:WhiB family redox-sensing transcriptional regulator